MFWVEILQMHSSYVFLYNVYLFILNCCYNLILQYFCLLFILFFIRNGHLVTHRAKKPYVCNVEGCDKSYCDNRSLRRHLENHHNKPSEVSSAGGNSVTSTSVVSAATNISIIPNTTSTAAPALVPTAAAAVSVPALAQAAVPVPAPALTAVSLPAPAQAQTGIHIAQLSRGQPMDYQETGAVDGNSHFVDAGSNNNSNNSNHNNNNNNNSSNNNNNSNGASRIHYAPPPYNSTVSAEENPQFASTQPKYFQFDTVQQVQQQQPQQQLQQQSQQQQVLQPASFETANWQQDFIYKVYDVKKVLLFFFFWLLFIFFLPSIILQILTFKNFWEH